MSRPPVGRRAGALRLGATALVALTVGAALSPTAEARALGRTAGAAARARVAIVGGSPAQPQRFPWIARLVEQRKSSPVVCTGTLVAPTLVLTAAHCLIDNETGQPFNPSQITVGVGGVELAGEGERPVQFAVSQLALDPNYSEANPAGPYDAGLVVLAGPASAPTVHLAGEAEGSLWSVGEEGVMVGWGRPSPEGSPSAVLRWAPAIIQQPQLCSQFEPQFVAAEQLCTLPPMANNSGGCFGDSGGPLIVQAANGPEQVGIIHGGSELCLTSVPAVDSGIWSVREWVERWIARLARSAPLQHPPPSEAEPAPEPSQPPPTPSPQHPAAPAPPPKLAEGLYAGAGEGLRVGLDYSRSQPLLAVAGRVTLRCPNGGHQPVHLAGVFAGPRVSRLATAGGTLRARGSPGIAVGLEVTAGARATLVLRALAGRCRGGLAAVALRVGRPAATGGPVDFRARLGSGRLELRFPPGRRRGGGGRVALSCRGRLYLEVGQLRLGGGGLAVRAVLRGPAGPVRLDGAIAWRFGFAFGVVGPARRPSRDPCLRAPLGWIASRSDW